MLPIAAIILAAACAYQELEMVENFILVVFRRHGE